MRFIDVKTISISTLGKWVVQYVPVPDEHREEYGVVGGYLLTLSRPMWTHGEYYPLDKGAK